MGTTQWDFFQTPEYRANPENANASFNFCSGKLGCFCWLAAIMAVSVGSITAQDVNQRLMSAKSEDAGVVSAVLSGVIYLVMGMIPAVLV